MAKQIVEVKDEKPKKKSLDLNKAKDFIVENKETIAVIGGIALDLINDNNKKKKTTKSTTKKATTKKSTKKDSDSMSKVIDLASTFLKK